MQGSTDEFVPSSRVCEAHLLESSGVDHVEEPIESFSATIDKPAFATQNRPQPCSRTVSPAGLTGAPHQVAIRLAKARPRGHPWEAEA